MIQVPIEITATGSVKTGVVKVATVVLVSSAANSTLVIDDSTTGSGSVKVRLSALANDSKIFNLSSDDIKFTTGVYATLTGVGAKAYIYYR